MSKATEPTLHDVLRELRALRADHGARLGGIDAHLEGIDGRLASHGEHLEGIDARMDSLEHSVTEVLGDGLANVQAAVENFAATKADRTELEAVRADVDALKEAAG